MTDDELVAKYFPNVVHGYMFYHNLMTDEHTFSAFLDCNLCGSLVHMDNLPKHAGWHEAARKTYDSLAALAQHHFDKS